MKYKVTFKGGANGATEVERTIDASFVNVGTDMTMLMSPGRDGYPLLIIPNDRLISIEHIG